MIKGVYAKQKAKLSSSSSSSPIGPKQGNEKEQNGRGEFHLFTSLTPELKVYIISFVADAPFEPILTGTNSTTTQKRSSSSSELPTTFRSSLTHLLPLVNKEFKSYCCMDIYWRDAIIRMLTQHEPELWTAAVEHVVDTIVPTTDTGTTDVSVDGNPITTATVSNASTVQDSVNNKTPYKNVSITDDTCSAKNKKLKSSSTSTTFSSSTNCINAIVNDNLLLSNDNETTSNIRPELVVLLNRAYNAMVSIAFSSSTTESKPGNNNNDKDTAKPSQSIYRELYKCILNNGIRQRGCPVFLMPCRISLGQPYGLHLFEPRYRLLIADVMRPLPDSAKHGGPIPLSTTTRSSSGISINSSSSSSNCYDPVFVHAFHNMPLKLYDNNSNNYETLAVLVRVLQCNMYSDGRADVLLLPFQYVLLERLYLREHSQNLVYSQIRILGRTELLSLGIVQIPSSTTD